MADLVDDARKQVRNDAWVIEQAGAKKRGRPKKGEESPVSSAKAVKSNRYSLLKNPDSLTESQ